MTEEEIIQALQTDLAQYRLKPVVKRKQSHLHVLLSRPEDVAVDYAFLTKQVCTRIRSLRLQEITQITIYGRVSGQKAYEWEETRQLTAEETLFFDRAKLEDYFRELDMAQPEDDPPTEVYQPKASSIPEPNPRFAEMDELTIVAPNGTVDQSGGEIPVQEEAMPTSYQTGPFSKPMIKVLAGVGAAVLVLVIALVFLL